MDIVYIVKCHYKIQKQKRTSSVVYQHILAHLEH
jgi:hypothetical protein